MPTSVELLNSLINNTSLMCHTSFNVSFSQLLLEFNEVLVHKERERVSVCGGMGEGAREEHRVHVQ